MQAPPQPLMAIRNITDPALANVTVPLAKPGLMHRFTDPDAGDALLVVTAPLPVRGFIKRQDFVELSLLESIHGVAVHPNSDDVRAEIAHRQDPARPARRADAVVGRCRRRARRHGGAAALRYRRVAREPGGKFHRARGRADRRRWRHGGRRAAPQARLDLARFYMARGLYQEAKGVADLVLSDAKPGYEDSAALMLRAVANILIGRPEQALKDLANPVIGTNYDSQLWRALADARQGKWAEAREKFKNVEFAIASLPVELQRIVLTDAMRASLEVKDYSGAARRRSDLDVVVVTPEMKPSIAVLRGRLAEALGHDRDALSDYKIAMRPDRAAAAEAKLRDIMLRQKREEISQADALRDLETLSMSWRGDAVEVKALQMMAHIYAETGRYNDALPAVRTATRLQPNSEISRQGQDMAAALFAELFLSPKGDDLPPVEALAMFFEFRELTPIGRRGDEMIRRLADRLVAVDLLDQAAELLQYQIDKRLEGAARAQVAARLAMVYLTHRKPDRAIAALRSHPHRRSLRRIAPAAAAAGSPRAERRRPPRSRARHHLQPRRPRGDPAALRHLLGVAEMARVGRADRTVLRRPLARLQTAEPGREGRRDPRRGRLCAGRRRHRAGALPRKIRAADERRGRPLRVRDREQAERQRRRIRRRSPRWRRASTRSTVSCAK